MRFSHLTLVTMTRFPCMEGSCVICQTPGNSLQIGRLQYYVCSCQPTRLGFWYNETKIVQQQNYPARSWLTTAPQPSHVQRVPCMHPPKLYLPCTKVTVHPPISLEVEREMAETSILENTHFQRQTTCLTGEKSRQMELNFEQLKLYLKR